MPPSTPSPSVSTPASESPNHASADSPTKTADFNFSVSPASGLFVFGAAPAPKAPAAGFTFGAPSTPPIASSSSLATTATTPTTSARTRHRRGKKHWASSNPPAKATLLGVVTASKGCAAELCERGYCVLPIRSPAELKLIEEAAAAAETAFAADAPNVGAQISTVARPEGTKKIFSVGASPMHALKVLLQDTADGALSAVGAHIHLPAPSSLAALVGERHEATIFSAMKYESGGGCEAHEDRGLLTLVVGQTARALEVYDRVAGEWTAPRLPEGAADTDEFVVALVGATLYRATAGLVPANRATGASGGDGDEVEIGACRHRVRPPADGEEPRMSLVLRVRARPDATFDCSALRGRPGTVERFTARSDETVQAFIESKNYSSVNAPPSNNGAATEAAESEGALRAGDRVLITGLPNRPELNVRMATVLPTPPAGGRPVGAGKVAVRVDADPPSQPSKLDVKVVTHEGEEIFFKMRPTTPFQQLTSTFCRRQHVDPQSMAFLFEGQRIRHGQTPSELGMTDGAAIHVVNAMTEQQASLLPQAPANAAARAVPATTPDRPEVVIAETKLKKVVPLKEALIEIICPTDVPGYTPLVASPSLLSLRESFLATAHRRDRRDIEDSCFILGSDVVDNSKTLEQLGMQDGAALIDLTGFVNAVFDSICDAGLAEGWIDEPTLDQLTDDIADVDKAGKLPRATLGHLQGLFLLRMFHAPNEEEELSRDEAFLELVLKRIPEAKNWCAVLLSLLAARPHGDDANDVPKEIRLAVEGAQHDTLRLVSRATQAQAEIKAKSDELKRLEQERKEAAARLEQERKVLAAAAARKFVVEVQAFLSLQLNNDAGALVIRIWAAQRIQASARGFLARRKGQLNLRVITQTGTEILFKCKQTTPLRKLIKAFCLRQGVNPASVRFLFDGQRINPEQTPQELEMEDGDVIDVMVEQQGD